MRAPVRRLLVSSVFVLASATIAVSLVSTAHGLHDAGLLPRRSSDAAAVEPPDAAPPPIAMKLTIDNVAEHPKYVFFLYPTTIGGFAVRVEPGKSYTKILRTKENGGSYLHAVPRSAYDRVAPKPRVRPVADEAANAEVFSPPLESVRSNVSFVVPTDIDGVPPLKAVERVFTVKKLTDAVFEIESKTDDVILKDGTRLSMASITADAAAHKPPPPPAKSAEPPPPATSAPLPAPSAAPKSGGCAASPSSTSSAPGAAVIPGLLLFVIQRRRRSRPPDGSTSTSVNTALS